MKELILPATAEDYYDAYGIQPAFSMRLYKVVEDDRTLAVFGYYYSGKRAVAFCNILGEFPAKKIYRVAKRCVEKLVRMGVPLVAVASDELCSSDNFLQHLGFEFAVNSSDGRIYQWQQQQYHS